MPYNSQPEVPVFIRPPMKDQEVWTGEPDYDRYLHIRCYKPEGLTVEELRCVLTCGKQYYKTKVLDPPPPLVCQIQWILAYI